MPAIILHCNALNARAARLSAISILKGFSTFDRKNSTGIKRRQPSGHSIQLNSLLQILRAALTKFMCIPQTQAERTAWDFCEKNGIDLVTINPTYVLGPVTSNRVDAQSVKNFIVRSMHPPCFTSCGSAIIVNLAQIKFLHRGSLISRYICQDCAKAAAHALGI